MTAASALTASAAAAEESTTTAEDFLEAAAIASWVALASSAVRSCSSLKACRASVAEASPARKAGPFRRVSLAPTGSIRSDISPHPPYEVATRAAEPTRTPQRGSHRKGRRLAIGTRIPWLPRGDQPTLAPGARADQGGTVALTPPWRSTVESFRAEGNGLGEVDHRLVIDLVALEGRKLRDRKEH